MHFPSEGFSGVVRIGDESWAFGSADRAHEIPNTVDTRFAIASGAKGFTALVATEVLDPGVHVRELLGDDLPLIDSRVTVEHLLRHTSGIGDYCDEEVNAFEAYVMPVPVHELATTEGYLAALDGRPQKFEPGERFSYNNSGFVVLALLAERATGRSFYELVDELVCQRSGMTSTGFLRSDDLPGDAALGYLEDGRTNVFHLPVRGNGDGGIYTTLDDIDRFWTLVTEDEPLGFAWTDPLRLVGADTGVSFTSARGRFTVISNTSRGAWPIVRTLLQ